MPVAKSFFAVEYDLRMFDRSSPCVLLALAAFHFLSGCAGPSFESGGEKDTALPMVPLGEVDTGDSAPKDDPATNAAWQAQWFSDTVVHEVAITLSEDARRSLTADPYEFATAAAVSFDGEFVMEPGIRLRGKIGSFRTLDGKPKFKIDFGEFVDGQELHGLKSMALNNEVVDCSYVREPVAYGVYRDAGVPAPRTGFTHVTVNGEDYGLYVAVEVPDSRFLADRLPGDDDGQLYDGKYAYYEDGSYTLLDFDLGVDALYQLEEGEENGNQEIFGMTAAIEASSASGSFGAGLDSAVDWDEIHTNFAVEQWLGHIDGYAMNRNNYRVYFRPSDGRMSIMPWDFDYAFLEDYSWGMSWYTPSGSIARLCWQDPACLAAQADGMRAVLNTIDTDATLTRIDGMTALIHDYAVSDPKRECANRRITAEQELVRAWVETRSDAMRAWWQL